jgi:hypothetical protein
MNTESNTTNDTFSFACLGVCLIGSLALFADQLVRYTNVLG